MSISFSKDSFGNIKSETFDSGTVLRALSPKSEHKNEPFEDNKH